MIDYIRDVYLIHLNPKKDKQNRHLRCVEVLFFFRYFILGISTIERYVCGIYLSIVFGRAILSSISTSTVSTDR